MNASALCADGGCDFACNQGFHRCGAECAANDDVTKCGAACMSCPGNGGVPVCVNQACDVTCLASQAKCGGMCVTESAAQCGPNCVSCPMGAQCVSGSCRLPCPSGTTQVGLTCVAGRGLESGLAHTCARHDGGVVCWGPGSTGALGSGPYDGGRDPRYVTGLGEVVTLALGDTVSCALLPDGGVRCWGSNVLGQVGNNGTLDQFTPAVVAVSGAATGLVSGSNHTCALLSDGGAECWGSNAAGQLGNGSTQTVFRGPAAVAAPGALTRLFAGDLATYAAVGDGGMLFWGDDATQLFTRTPRAIFSFDGGARSVEVATNHGCAIRLDDRVECWGRGSEGQLGRLVMTTAEQPSTIVPNVAPARALCVGLNFTCVLLQDAGTLCFGDNAYGQLGTGNYNGGPTPMQVVGLPAASELSCHNRSVCARVDTGIMCWGDNSLSQLGQPTPPSATMPLSVPLP